MPSTTLLGKGGPLTAARRWRASGAVLLVLAAASVRASELSYDRSTIIDTRTEPGFGNATPALKGYLRTHRRSRARPQHFCVVGYRFRSDDARGFDQLVWVHWREGRRLALWQGASGPEYLADSLRYGRRDLDLTKDVVATDADVNSSTYLVTRAWVRKVQKDCAAKGAHYIIR